MRKNERKPGEVFTAMQCEKCGEFYEADREHVCRKKNSYQMKDKLNQKEKGKAK